MAKGDSGRAQKMIDTQQQQWNSLMPQMRQNYNFGAQTGMKDYGDIMNRYRSFMDSGAGRVSGTGNFGSYGGFENFSKTGGFSPEDIANMRARGVAPIRASYANAEREMGRQRALQGGYSPNFMAASAKMAREQGQSAADALQNTNAGLAQMIQSGKLAGLSGMSDIEKAQLQASLQAGMFNAELPLRALSGMTSLYGTSPAMASTFGNQLLSGMSGQQGLIGQQIQKGYMPTTWDTVMGRIGDIGNLVSGAVTPWL